MKLNRISRLTKLFLLHIVMSFVMLCIFLLSLFLFNRLLAQERSRETGIIQSSIAQNFISEYNRLTILTELCKHDRSLVMTAANKLSTEKFVSYSLETIEKLGLLQYSLPYAEAVFLYVKNNDCFITSKGSVMTRQVFYQSNRGYISPEDIMPDFSLMESGFHVFSDFVYYVTDLQGNGLLIIQIDPYQFAQLNSSAILSDAYEAAIIYNQKYIFTATSKELAAKVTEFEDDELPGTGLIDLNAERYYVTASGIYQDEFILVLAAKQSVLQKSQNDMLLFGTIVSLIVFILCLIQFFSSYRVYSPIKTLAGRFMTKVDRDEIMVLDNKLSELNTNVSLKNDLLREQKKLQIDIALSSAFLTGSSLNKWQEEALKEEFTAYIVMVIASQCADGSDGLFTEINTFLIDRFTCRILKIEKNVYSYIIEIITSADSTMKILVNELPFSNDSQYYIGISDENESISSLYTAYLNARERMFSNYAFTEGNVSVCNEYLQTHHEPRHISLEKQNIVAASLFYGDRKDIETLLVDFLLSDKTITLQNYILLYQRLSELIMTILSSSGIDVSADTFLTQQFKKNYHPAYMYQCLHEDFIYFNSCYHSNHIKLKYQVLEFLGTHYMEPICLDSVADHFGITPVYLSAWFKKNLSINFSVYLSNLRMEKAKEYLEQDLSIKITDIAQKVGISNISTFNRQFKSHVGVSPDQYRKLKTQSDT